MDPKANLARQRELAAEIIALTDSLPSNGIMLDYQADALVIAAGALATHVQTLDEWRRKFGFDPYDDAPETAHRPVDYASALRIVCDFTEGLTSENSEYERGQLEALADMFPLSNVETDVRKGQIAREIRALDAHVTDAPSEPAITVTGFGFAPINLSYEEWVRDEIQDDDEALRIAKHMLATNQTYAWNEGGEPNHYREFDIYDGPVLRSVVASLEAVKTAPTPADRENDQRLALWFTPQAIRDHFDGDEGKIGAAVREATDEQLATIGEWCLQADTLYAEFHRLLAYEARQVLKVEEG